MDVVSSGCPAKLRVVHRPNRNNARTMPKQSMLNGPGTPVPVQMQTGVTETHCTDIMLIPGGLGSEKGMFEDSWTVRIGRILLEVLELLPFVLHLVWADEQ